MDPPVVGISTERFTTLWEVFQGEANKLASGMECSGMEMYSSIYQIVSGGDVSYAVRLHWCIGKFFFALAVKLRQDIEGDDWIDKYVEAFKQYEMTVETIDLLSLHLNEAIIENKECKNVKDLGYVIWERCILRYRYERKLPSFSDSLPQKREHADVCLRSLSKIVVNSENRFEYYKNNYETSLIGKIVSEFRKEVDIITEDLPSYLIRCSCAITAYKEAYACLFLPSSLPVLEETLEKVLFSKKSDDIKSRIERILHRRDKKEIQRLCEASRKLTKKVFPVFLMYANEFCLSAWPHSTSCASIAAAYKDLADLLSAETCEKTQEVLQKTLSIKITHLGVGKALSEYVEDLIYKKDHPGIKVAKVLLDSISIKEEKEIFYTMYISKLAERLLSLKFSPLTEKTSAESFEFPWIVKKKIRRIFDDMVRSTRENEAFLKSYGSSEYIYKLHDGNEIFFYTIVATACVWPIPEDTLQNIRMPNEIKSIAQMFASQYIEKNPRRKLTWVDIFSYVEIEIETDRIYLIEMPLAYYSVLKVIEEEPRTMDKITVVVGISTKMAVNILESLKSISIIVCTEGTYAINSQFTCYQSRIRLQASEFTAARSGNRKSYYQAWVSRTLKSAKELLLSELSERMQKQHTDIFKWNTQEYTDALRNLNERGLIEIVDSTVRYIP